MIPASTSRIRTSQKIEASQYCLNFPNSCILQLHLYNSTNSQKIVNLTVPIKGQDKNEPELLGQKDLEM
ncbi:hypothetical protein TNIN_313401 [Trichonephila inaurata madagascariensis]|uniref:Uncharacterized protein n=1 Tax=Trichonephila inaurata madagascariensis TaxID=2747483 RepID=A0A8X6I911_9ARAC|nr:hypothetical protein TNIN_313401 [Trichonephila inaurata madagascariensis]